MQFSAVLLAAFAATALAAPAEQATTVKSLDEAPVENNDYPADTTTEYPETNTEYPETNTEYPETTTDDYAPTNSEYPTGNSGSEYEGTEKYDSYKPVDQSCYTPGKPDEYQTKYGKDLYFSHDQTYVKKYEEYSPVNTIYYPEQIDANEPCPISWTVKDKSYKEGYSVGICKSTDGYQKCEDVCHDEDSCNKYVIPDTYTPSDDSKDGCMYKFKVYKKTDESACTYSKDFAIYNKVYYEKNVECKPAPEKCPPRKEIVPVKVTEVSPAAPVESAPVATYAPTVNAPTPVADVSAVDIANSGSAVRASFSALVGIAAVVAFAL